MPEFRRPRAPRSLLVPVVAVLVASQLAWPALAGAEEGTPSPVGAGDTVVGELVQAWAEHADPEAAEHADEGPLTWVETAEGEAVRIPTESIEDLQRAEVGATVSVTVGDEVADAAAAEDDVEPAREVLDAAVVEAAPADAPQPTAAAGAVTHAVTVVMVVPAGAVADSRPLQQVVDTVNGTVSSYWAGQSDTQVVIGVTGAQDLRDRPLAARCDQPFPMWDEVARRIGWTPAPGRHLLLHLPAGTPNCADGLAVVGSSLNGGGRLYVRDVPSSPEVVGTIVTHEMGHNFGLGHASEQQCDRALETGSCRVRPYYDWYDVMGVSWSELGTLNAPHAAKLGLLPAGERVALTPSSPSGRYTLAPMAAPDGTRAVQLTGADGAVYWLEYRQASGQDGWLGTWRNRRSLDQGVTLRRAADVDGDSSLLLDGTPSTSGGWDGDLQVALPVARPTPVAHGAFTVTVESVGATATVRVDTGREAPRADPNGSSYLNAGESLSGDRRLQSPNGRYRMVAQADGNVVVYALDGRVLWASGVWSPGARLDLQPDGNLVAYATDGRPVWNSRTWGSGATRLVMQDDGNLVLYRTDGRAAWSTGWDTPDRLRPGQQLFGGQALTSPTGRYRAVMQTDGNLVVQAADGRVLWASGVYTRYGRLVLQPDGNVVTYATNGRPVWDTRTWENGSSRLVLQDDGNLVLYRADGRATWWSGWDTPDRLRPGQQLSGDQALTSPNGRYRLVAQADGNVVVYTATGRAVWATGTYWRGTRLVQQHDGNLVSYAPDGRAVWSTGTWWSPGALALVQDDGSLAVRRPDGVTLWTTGPDRSG